MLSCGLVMKEDITQRMLCVLLLFVSCGLVMKEDITQLVRKGNYKEDSCGLVMKEDITQHDQIQQYRLYVVVW